MLSPHHNSIIIIVVVVAVPNNKQLMSEAYVVVNKVVRRGIREKEYVYRVKRIAYRIPYIMLPINPLRHCI